MRGHALETKLRGCGSEGLFGGKCQSQSLQLHARGPKGKDEKGASPRAVRNGYVRTIRGSSQGAYITSDDDTDQCTERTPLQRRAHGHRHRPTSSQTCRVGWSAGGSKCSLLNPLYRLRCTVTSHAEVGRRGPYNTAIRASTFATA